jgi:hypothetical protein
MSKTRWRVASGAVALVVVALAAGLTAFLTSGGGKGTKQPNAVAYAQLWSGTRIGSSMPTVLARWPKPYQKYADGSQQQCFEWWDKPTYLYNLCFKDGVLASKDIT